MECLYLPELSENQNDINLIGDELKHLFVLRLRVGEKIIITNGKGLSAISSLKSISKNIAILSPQEYFINSGELAYPLGLAIGILDNRERFEFTLEKSIELGISDFYPLITDFTQKKTIQKTRLEAKAISALKQSHRSNLTTIHPPISLQKLFSEQNKFDTIILADYNGVKPELTKLFKSSLVLIGPEGGFSYNEIEFIKNQKSAKSINIANRRLRAETAAILAVGLVALNMKE